MTDRSGFAIAALAGSATVTALAIIAASVRPLATLAASGHLPLGWRFGLAAALEVGLMLGWPIAWGARANASAKSGESVARQALGESPSQRARSLAPIALGLAIGLAATSFAWGKVATGAATIDATRCPPTGRSAQAIAEGVSLLCDGADSKIAMSGPGFVAIARVVTIDRDALRATDVELATTSDAEVPLHARVGTVRASATSQTISRSPLSPSLRAFAVSMSALVAALFVVASTFATRGRSTWATTLHASLPAIAGFSFVRVAESSSAPAALALLAPASAIVAALVVEAALRRANGSR
jgi:hypothetical protein